MYITYNSNRLQPFPFTSSGMGDISSALGAGVTAGLVGGAISLIGTGINAWISSARQRGSQKIGASNLANEAESFLKRNLAAWNTEPHTAENKAAALANTVSVFDFLRGQSGCGNEQLGSAGQRCVNERIGPTELADGSKFPWKSWYYDPIANTPVDSGSSVSLASTTGGLNANNIVDAITAPFMNIIPTTVTGNGTTTATNYNPLLLALGVGLVIYLAVK